MASKKEKKYSFVIYSTAYSTAIKKLSLEDKGRLFDALLHEAGSEIAEKPELSPLLEMALSPFVDGMRANAIKFEAKCEANRLAGSTGGKRRVANASERKRMLENQANASVPSEIKRTQAESSVFNHEYEYELTTTAKSNILSNTELCSIDDRPSETKRSLEDGSERLQVLDDATAEEDDYPPDCDPADEPLRSCSFDFEQDMALQEQDERSEEDSPF